ncbi:MULTISPECIES: cysteine--tRNA ligase [unclassified Arcicella]|uniref:cysteine--tRNA ligase n=1 Tax=unclassified Arcicella TaxID=2644986 RepID=UPI00285AD882|nr:MULTISPECIES: cysteine--tRNA ligase [unclassified Arcicella]MDR6563852.1 cysteinyl-tRNA synthetase [Arcicella sp. BE51]MDR6813605.1 cysteinyl-tRNA synthetase [Arcicella sp. BE140]MDR6825014.1 cysteinyl-tRNA synthetase [Arcicella sp. BE139]
MQPLKIYNTLSREKELFTPINAPHVGMYVCGPTVYNYVHLGNVRTFLTFDILNRYLTHIGYKVRYVRNITDVGHLVGDGDEGEDKIGKMAKLEKLEPMEIVQRYTNDFHKVLLQFNLLPPSIEPSATGHIVEQIETTKSLIDKGLAYESQGSVYFDIARYNAEGGNYGKLSGRVLDDLLTETRDLDGVGEKRNPLDFALWKKAAPEHLMRWTSPWGDGFPGWHLECTCMSTKYLGDTFDIHGGGMDLKFPHHECEIAQAKGVNGVEPVRYWMHANMLTVNGQKMSKSLGNSFLPSELITGSHPLLDQAYSPMTVRFFMLQSQYRSTLDFSNEALKAAQKGYKRLINGLRIIKNIEYLADDLIAVDEKHVLEVEKGIQACYDGLNDDLNTAVAIAGLFNLVKKINQIYMGQLQTAQLGEQVFTSLKESFIAIIENVLGLIEEPNENIEAFAKGMLSLYREYKEAKQYDKVDEIRGYFKANGLVIKDMKTKIDWAYEE